MIGNIYPNTEWELARQACFTSSECSRLQTPGKRAMTEWELGLRPKSGTGSKTTMVDDYTILSDGAMTYVLEKVSELMTGTVRQFTSIATDWGNDMEPKAIVELKKIYPNLEYFGNENKKFFKLTRFSGGSPDATDKTIVFEIKCPENPANHIENLLLKSVDKFKETHPDYYAQIQMNMMCVAKEKGFQFKDMTGMFVSYCPMMINEGLVLKTLSIPPDFEFEANIIKAIETAEKELKAIVEELTSTKEEIDPKYIEQAKEMLEGVDYQAKIKQGKELRKSVNI